MKTVVVYVHGKGGSASEAAHFRPLFAGCEVLGFDYHAETPWDAKLEFASYFENLKKQFDSIVLVANSIGAYFSMCALSEALIDRSFFISPVVDMKRLIEDMMLWANVSKEELQARGSVPTSFGELLSWTYYTYVCDHPVVWNVPTEILYGERDNLIARDAIKAFVGTHNAGLTIMENGEHWFHTIGQFRFLDDWIRKKAGE